MQNDLGHISVLKEEVVNYLNIDLGKKYIDATVGGGGHTEAILQNGGVVLGIDQDPTSLEKARRNLEARYADCEARQACPGPDSVGILKNLHLVQGNFSHIAELASKNGFDSVSGILFDLGYASFQIDDPNRGLSFLGEGPLDMRLDPNLEIKAEDVVNNFPEKALEMLIREFGDESKAHLIAREIVKSRETQPIKTTSDLKNLIINVYRSEKIGKIHVATRTFQALRIFVNAEFENLKAALEQSIELLKPEGRLVVISFHSGEDRIVKNIFREWENQDKVKVLSKKPIKPTDFEITNNPRSRSALLRVIEKI